MRVPLRTVATGTAASATQQSHRPEQEAWLGYLLTDETPATGYFGGLLIITSAGRPVAFHYTQQPVKPTEMHRILYGASLESFVRGHLIACSLLRACRHRPKLLLVSDGLLVSLQPTFGVPTAAPFDESLPAPPDCAVVTVAGTKWLIHGREGEHVRRLLADQLEAVGGVEVLIEPFGRVRAALERLIGSERGAEVA